MIKNISILNLSDLHFGHPKTPTNTIVSNLWYFIKNNYSLIRKVDFIIISGDYYHRLLSNGSTELNAVISFTLWLVNFCAKENIRLRIMKGTPSHDWDQVSTLNTMLKNSESTVDFRYVSHLYIENIPDLDMNILYVPDELNHDASITYKEILRLMESKALSQVDLIVTHGEYEHHLPIHPRLSTHSAQDYLSLTDNYILNGHIHTNSVFKRILTPGSFDRLNHGEEEKKGGFLIYLNINQPNTYIFLENKNSKNFVTIDIKEEINIQKAFLELKLKIKKLSKESHIRLMFNRDNPLRRELNLFRSEFPNFFFIIKDFKEEKDTEISEEIYKEILGITKENIKGLLLESMSGVINGKDIEIFNQEIDKFIK